MSSIFSSLIGLTNSQARILFNSGREGLLPKFFGRVHAKHQTPHMAMWTFIAIAVLIVVGFGRNVHPVDLFGYAATLGTIPIILTYLITNLALPIYMRKHHRAEFRFGRHFLLPALGTALMLMPLWGLVEPGQPKPFNLFPYVAIVVLVVSLIYGFILTRKNPQLALSIGSFVADE